jgi:hypothetical protein
VVGDASLRNFFWPATSLHLLELFLGLHTLQFPSGLHVPMASSFFWTPQRLRRFAVLFLWMLVARPAGRATSIHTRGKGDWLATRGVLLAESVHLLHSSSSLHLLHLSSSLHLLHLRLRLRLRI